jgi:hypothetical protein
LFDISVTRTHKLRGGVPLTLRGVRYINHLQRSTRFW